jgi:peptidoglycan/xylan/chitin deacetylase (PgdA/CDA1 family)
MATTEHEEPAPPQVAPEPGVDGTVEASGSRSTGRLFALGPRKLLSHGRPFRGKLRAASGVALALSLVVLLRASGASAGVGLASPEPGLPSPAPIAAATTTPTTALAPAATSTPEPALTPAPDSASPDPAQSPLSALLTPQPGRVFEHGDTSRSDVYITIDDCHNWANVEKDLQTANAAGIQVTLFPAGKYVDAGRETASRVLLEAVSYGDEIGNHTYTHSRLDTGSMSDIKADLDAQLAVVRNALNDKTYKEWFARPPYGSGLGNGAFVTAAVKDGLAIAMWSDDSKGYQSGSTVEFVLQNVFNPKHFKNGAIILMHDDDTDTAALPLILDGIRARGFSVGGVLSNILAPAGSAAWRGADQASGRRLSEIVVRAESVGWKLGYRRPQ